MFLEILQALLWTTASIAVAMKLLDSKRRKAVALARSESAGQRVLRKLSVMMGQQDLSAVTPYKLRQLRDHRQAEPVLLVAQGRRQPWQPRS